jgi:hypothetical protein
MAGPFFGFSRLLAYRRVEYDLSRLLLLLPLVLLQDVFSLGCVIAELWLDGRAFFDLSRLLAYRRGEYDPSQALTGVAPDIAELIMHMIQRAPGAVVFVTLLCYVIFC